MSEHHFLDDLPLLALGACQGDERKRIEEHLASGCDLCETELHALRDVVALLPYALPERRPPDGLKERVLAGIAGLGETEAPAAAPPHPGRRRGWRIGLAVAAIVGLGVAIFLAATRQKEIEILQAEKQSLAALLNEEERQLAWMRDPQVQRAVLKGIDSPAKARFLFHAQTRQGLLFARGLPPPPEGTRYELWAFVEGDPCPAGAFETGTDGAIVFPVPRLECLGRNPDRFAVSVEPKGGTPRPTGPVVLLGGLL